MATEAEHGQVWESLDPRDDGRTIYIETVRPPYIYGLSRFKRRVRIHESRLREPFYRLKHDAPWKPYVS